MPANIEVKALLPRPDNALKILRSHTELECREIMQRDVFLPTENSYLKLRYNNDSLHALISYQRSTMPFPRDSEFEKIDLDQDPALVRLAPFLEAVCPVGVVEKHRLRFSDSTVIINVDNVVGVDSLVEIEALDAASPAAQQRVCERWTGALSISAADVIPYSNIHLVQMYARKPTNLTIDHGQLIALDGLFSQSADDLALAYASLVKEKVSVARADCSINDASSAADVHPLKRITSREYFSRCLRGDYCWFFDLAFSQGFGLPWDEVEIAAGDVLFVPLPPGGGPFFKRMFPSSMTVLLILDAAVPKQQFSPAPNTPGCLAEVIRQYQEAAIQLQRYYDLVVETQGRSNEQVGSAILDYAKRQPCRS